MTGTDAARPAAAAQAMIVPLALAQFIASYAATNMNVAISTIAKDIGTTVIGMQTTITLFTLTMASLMIPGSQATVRPGGSDPVRGGPVFRRARNPAIQHVRVVRLPSALATASCSRPCRRSKNLRPHRSPFGRGDDCSPKSTRKPVTATDIAHAVRSAPRREIRNGRRAVGSGRRLDEGTIAMGARDRHAKGVTSAFLPGSVAATSTIFAARSS